MIWVILGIVAVIIVWLVIVYNRLVTLRQVTGQSWSDVDVQLKQRHDLIPNLVETVKGYAAHEQESFQQVIAARNSAGGTATPEAEAAFGKAIGNLLALGEAYPDLKASANFQALQGELADIEDKLAAARRALNAVTARYNAARESFPAVMFASAMGFQEADFHALTAEERPVMGSAPQVKFQ